MGGGLNFQHSVISTLKRAKSCSEREGRHRLVRSSSKASLSYVRMEEYKEL